MKWLLLLIILLLTPLVHSISNYSNWDYGAGDYGRNTMPEVLATQPSSLTPQFLTGSNVTFNLTFVDWDGDSMTLEWVVNGNYNNTNNKNLSYQFSAIGTYNVTGNISDAQENTYITWIVQIKLSFANITDILITPTIVQVGNVFIVTANATAISSNLTNVSASLNITNFQFTPLTPQLQTIDSIWTNNATSIVWYISAPLSPTTKTVQVLYVDTSGNFTGQKKNIRVFDEGIMTPEGITILLLFFVILIAIILITLGIKFEDIALFSIGGAIITLTGSYIWINGFAGLSDKLTTGLGLVMVVVGGYIFVVPTLTELIEQLKQWR